MEKIFMVRESGHLVFAFTMENFISSQMSTRKRLSDLKPGTEQIIIPKGSGAGEGSHFYKINGKYFITLTNWDPVCYQVCARAEKPFGPYEITPISSEENF